LAATNYRKEQSLELGTFSISLAAKDNKVSKAFYEKLGFKVFVGDISQNWLILKNREHAIGFFQGMSERNTLTFNPGT
jgi:lactoylglutathione lyase